MLKKLFEKKMLEKYQEQIKFLKSLKHDLSCFHDLEKLDVNDVFYRSVKFFRMSSKYFDKVYKESTSALSFKTEFGLSFFNQKMFKFFDIKDDLGIIFSHIKNMGRDRYGFNRADIGKEVTSKNVYWGNYSGIWTFNVDSWIETEDLESKETIAKGQVLPFIESHLKCIKYIDNVLDKLSALED